MLRLLRNSGHVERVGGQGVTVISGQAPRAAPKRDRHQNAEPCVGFQSNRLLAKREGTCSGKALVFRPEFALDVAARSNKYLTKPLAQDGTGLLVDTTSAACRRSS